MKKIKYIFLCLGVIAMIAACNKILDTTPKDGSISDVSFFKTTTDFDSYMFGIYIDIMGGFDVNGVVNLTKVGSFVSQEVTGPDETGKSLPQYMSASNGQISSIWVDCYDMIAKANQILDKLPGAAISEDDKTRLEGEALFLRGYGYFGIARTFGQAPLILKPYDASQNKIASSSEADIWAQVVADFTAAAPKIPTRADWGDDNLGRATQGTVYAFLANAYMYQKDWAKAEAASNSLIALNTYKLLPDIQAAFSETNNNNDESIFEVQSRNSLDGKINWNGFEAGLSFPEMTAPRNIGDQAPGGGWGEMVLTRKHADSYEAGDERRTKMLKVPGEKYKGENMEDTLLIPLDIIQPNSAFSTKYWHGPASEAEVNYIVKCNAPLMRYAEFLLNYSEILFMGGKTTEAYEQMNLVRKRAKLADLPASADQATYMAALMNERRHELNMEPNLWFHYTRTGTAADFLLNNYDITWQAKWNRFPIPQGEKDQNPNLSQNEGY